MRPAIDIASLDRSPAPRRGQSVHPETSTACEAQGRRMRMHTDESGSWRLESGTDPRALFELVYAQMRGLACEGGDTLDDLVQIAFEQVLKALPSFRHEAQLSTFTYSICYRTLLKQRRWYARWLKRFTLTADGELPDRAGQTPSAPETLERFERSTRLRDAVGALPPKRRATVILCDLEGLSVDEVSEIVGANPSTVRSRLRDGRRQLGERLAQDPYFGRRAHEEEA